VPGRLYVEPSRRYLKNSLPGCQFRLQGLQYSLLGSKYHLIGGFSRGRFPPAPPRLANESFEVSRPVSKALLIPSTGSYMEKRVRLQIFLAVEFTE
jgi:hypothetical protein